MSSSLNDLLSNPEKLINISVELASVKRSDGTTKTWYFARYVSDLLLTAQPTFLPYLRSVGPLTSTLNEDSQFGGMAESSIGSVLLAQDAPDTDLLSQLSDYTFSGRNATIKIGELGVDAYTSWYTLRVAEIDQEPALVLTDSGPQVSIPLSSPISRLISDPTADINGVLGIKRHVGIPHCLRFLTATGKATVTRIAAYDLTRFTIIMRFRALAAIDGNINLTRKLTAITTSSNWRLLITTAGNLTADLSTGGAGLAFQMTTPLTSYADGNWHVVVFAVNANLDTYLMVDNVVTNTATPTGVADLAVAPIEMALRGAGGTDIELSDSRLYSRYMTADEARTVSTTVIDGNDLSLVGYWKFDDNTGATANDYSPNNNDAAIAGVLNTDYSWQASKFGEAELAGRPYPLVVGIPFNCLAHFIDTLREIFRTSDSNLETNNRTVNLKTRGIALVQTTDYTDNADGTFTMVGAEDEPVTFDLTQSTSHQNNVLAVALYNVMSNNILIDVDQTTAMLNLLPWSVGYYSQEDPTIGAILSSILSSVYGHYREEWTTGQLLFDFLLPPLGLGPYSEPSLDFRGRAQLLTFGDIADVTGSFTVAGWFKTFATDQNTDSASSSSNRQVIIEKLGIYTLDYVMAGSNSGKLRVTVGGTIPVDLYSPAGLVTDGTWIFVAGVFDDTANTVTIYAAAQGGTLASVGSATGATTVLSVNTNHLQIGYSVFGSVQHLQVWNVTRNLSQLQALMTTPPVGNESNLVAYIPLSNGSTAVEVVTSTSATISPIHQRWSPRLTLNLSQTPSVKLSDFKHLHPAYEIIVRYARNWHPMTDADISSSVTQNSRIALRAEWKEAIWRSQDNKTRYKRARRLEPLDTCLTDREDAQRLTRMLATRFGTDRYLVVVDIPPTKAGMPPLAVARLACGLQLTDEVRVVSAIPSQLASGRNMRVVALTQDPVNLTARLVLWG